jgi:hypothetical protein
VLAEIVLLPGLIPLTPGRDDHLPTGGPMDCVEPINIVGRRGPQGDYRT